MTDDTPRRTVRPLAVLAALGSTLALSLSLAGPAATADAADRVPKVADLGPTSFAVRGPFAVGEARLKLPPTGSAVEVWYPSRKADAKGKRPARYDVVDALPPSYQAVVPDGASVTYPSGGVRGLDVARGRFPLVVFSHGFAGFPTQSSFLTSWLASWGFVVAAPDHPNRDLAAALSFSTSSTGDPDVKDLSRTITLMRSLDRAARGRFSGHVDTDLVGAVGHSAGGSAVEALAAVDKRITTFVGLAGASVGALTGDAKGPRTKVPHQPGLLMAGTADGIITPDRMEAAYDQLRDPKRLVLVGGGHHAFSDLCEIGAGDGGLLAIADLLGLPVPESFVALATDGCSPPALPPTEAWPAIRQTVVAHLRHEFGFDRSRKALRGLVAAYPGVVSGNRTD
ncbi:alpha/beta hydrolase family protein [Nocardioides hankookensis]|uniref:Alpha/beta hydrolase family protein n=1 Tax=Nocardioides hankookensis TaxID=443157 RepID=A0ABW1LMX8_9ACTN